MRNVPTIGREGVRRSTEKKNTKSTEFDKDSKIVG
jgi:hypothetical protein